MKVTIITACYNSEKTVQRTIESVLSQNYHNIEYIIIDGKSSDQTMPIVNNYKNKITSIISENDKGIYDALNKGLKIANGDIIGFLHSDDFYPKNNIISSISDIFRKKPEIGIVIGDVAFVKNNNEIKRKYSGENFNFTIGIMPPHPAVFIKKENYEEYGKFNTDYKIAADYEVLFKLIEHYKIRYEYSSEVIVHMGIGGISNKNIFSSITLNKEIYKIHKALGQPISFFSLLKKIPKRLRELIF